MLTFSRLKYVSFVHSAVYVGLLYAAFLGGKPEPETFVLGLTHGLLWIGMSLACLAALRKRVIPMHLAVAVCVLGGFGPFRRDRSLRPRAAPPRIRLGSSTPADSRPRKIRSRPAKALESPGWLISPRSKS